MNSLFLLARVDGSEIAMTALVGGFVIVIVAISFGALASIAKNRQREQTKREIAAYVAEGSISPQDARVLLTAEPDHVLHEKIADGLAWGTLSAEGAERLIKASKGTDAKVIVS